MAKKFEKQLYEVLASLKNEKDAERFILDLCTPQEIEHLSERLASAILLKEGKTYSEVLSKVNVSSATLSRVSKCVKYSDGYNKVLDAFLKENEE